MLSNKNYLTSKIKLEANKFKTIFFRQFLKGLVLIPIHLTETLKNLNWKSLNQPNNFSLMWIDTCAGLTESFGLIKPWQMVNHIPGLNELLARKSRLYRNLHRVAQILPRE